MDFKLILSILLPLIGIFLWVRRESRADFRQLDTKIDAKVEGLNSKIDKVGKDVNSLEKEIIRITLSSK